jgi:RimJ/RimL family protein N-acetyltransferase
MKIETERLILRKHELADFDRFWEMINDPIAKRYTGGVTRLTYEQRLELFREECDRPFSDESAEFAVIEQASGTYLGYCGFRIGNDVDGPEFLYGFCRDCWGRGYGFEAARAALRYLFSAYEHNRYLAAVDAENQASVRILLKLGFRKSGGILLDGTHPADLYIVERANLSAK